MENWIEEGNGEQKVMKRRMRVDKTKDQMLEKPLKKQKECRREGNGAK